MAGISGTYRLTAVGYKMNATATEQPVYDQWVTEACEKDDQITLNANGTFTYTDAGVKCNPDGGYTSTWSLNGSTITVDGDPATIQSFSCSSLVIIGTDVLTPGDQVRFTYTRL